MKPLTTKDAKEFELICTFVLLGVLYGEPEQRQQRLRKTS